MLKKINDVKIYTVVLFLIFTGKSIINLNSQQYFYGDDSWLLLGSRFDSLLDSLRCCAVSHPVRLALRRLELLGVRPDNHQDLGTGEVGAPDAGTVVCRFLVHRPGHRDCRSHRHRGYP